MIKILLSTLAITVVLFIWSGASQMFPWGTPSAQKVSAQSQDTEPYATIEDMIRVSPDALTTEDFDGRFKNKVSTYITDYTFSWIITQRLQTDYGRYFVNEILTQLCVAILLSLLLFLSIPLNLTSRILIVALAGVCASAATYGQLMNWWGLPAAYGLGVSFNLVAGWLIASFISGRFILKSVV